MKTPRPTAHDIEALVAFLPRLEAAGFRPIKRWWGGPEGQGKAFTMPWPEYDDLVVEFFGAASRGCWIDFGYHPGEARRMLEDKDLVAAADLDQIKTMLTYCVRGERFCDGHWAAMIEGGYIRRLLQRLAEIGASTAGTGG